MLVTGCALSETHDGGYAEFARVPGDWIIPLPAGMSAFDAMAIGTAGFTAAFAIDRMEQNGQVPEGGPIVVTGASGGVGSLEHIFEGLTAGKASAALAASIFHYREYTVAECKRFLSERGIPVRPPAA